MRAGNLAGPALAYDQPTTESGSVSTLGSVRLQTLNLAGRPESSDLAPAKR